MKKLFKTLFKTEAFRTFICWMVTNYIRFVHYTSFKTYEIDDAAKPYMQGKKPLLFAFWHARLLMMPMLRPPGRKMNVLISTHRDGELISRAMNNFGFETIRGSSTRGGSSAAIKAVKALQLGENVAITPDGPKGPAQKIQGGIIDIAAMSNVPIIAITSSASRNKRMRSWDRFMVSLPFGRIHYRASAPMFNPTKEELEIAMNAQVRDADGKYA